MSYHVCLRCTRSGDICPSAYAIFTTSAGRAALFLRVGVCVGAAGMSSARCAFPPRACRRFFVFCTDRAMSSILRVNSRTLLFTLNMSAYFLSTAPTKCPLASLIVTPCCQQISGYSRRVVAKLSRKNLWGLSPVNKSEGTVDHQDKIPCSKGPGKAT